jgi:hypothetical protein
LWVNPFNLSGLETLSLHFRSFCIVTLESSGRGVKIIIGCRVYSALLEAYRPTAADQVFCLGTSFFPFKSGFADKRPEASEKAAFVRTGSLVNFQSLRGHFGSAVAGG